MNRMSYQLSENTLWGLIKSTKELSAASLHGSQGREPNIVHTFDGCTPQSLVSAASNACGKIAVLTHDITRMMNEFTLVDVTRGEVVHAYDMQVAGTHSGMLDGAVASILGGGEVLLLDTRMDGALLKLARLLKSMGYAAVTQTVVHALGLSVAWCVPLSNSNAVPGLIVTSIADDIAIEVHTVPELGRGSRVAEMASFALEGGAGIWVALCGSSGADRMPSLTVEYLNRAEGYKVTHAFHCAMSPRLDASRTGLHCVQLFCTGLPGINDPGELGVTVCGNGGVAEWRLGPAVPGRAGRPYDSCETTTVASCDDEGPNGAEAIRQQLVSSTLGHQSTGVRVVGNGAALKLIDIEFGLDDYDYVDDDE
jgi:hypothetical protein